MAASSRNPGPSRRAASPEPKTAFVSTLGGKPQVFTSVLDCLIETHGLIDRALAVHLAPSDPRINRAVNVLRAETAARYRSAFRFDSITIRDQPDAALLSAGAFASGRVITSIEDYAAPNAIWLTMHRLLTTLKAEGYRIILAVTGGPRLIGLQAVSVASLLFAPHDRCVHLFTPPDLSEAAGEGTILHVPNFAKRGIRLVEHCAAMVMILMISDVSTLFILLLFREGNPRKKI